MTPLNRHWPHLLVLLAALGCGPTATPVSSTRPKGSTDLNAYDIECPSRSACESEARRLCPSGYRVSGESFNEGTSLSRANAEQTGPLPQQKWSGQPNGWMRVVCY